MAWDPSGERLASGSRDKKVRIWDPASGRRLQTLKGHEEGVLSIAWDPIGERIASASSDDTVAIWDAASGRRLQTLEGHKKGVRSVAWDPNGERLASGSRDQTLGIWDATSGRRLLTLSGHQQNLTVTADGDVVGPPEALTDLLIADGWALYELADVPEHLLPEGVRRALARAASPGDGTAGSKP